MTLASPIIRNQYNGDGSTASFPITFVTWGEDDTEVILTDANGNETVWTRGTQYTIALVSPPAASTLNVVTSPTDYTPASGERLTITSKMANTQSTSLPLGGALPSTAVEQMGDQAVRLVQQLDGKFDRAMVVPAGDALVDMSLPGSTARANKALQFDSSGKPSAVTPTDASGTVVTATGSTTGRTLAERFAQEFDPLDHGCKFDGVTDDASAFQTMVDLAEAAAPAIIVMPAGTTNWGSTVTIDTSKVALVGQGPYETIIQGTFAAGDILYVGDPLLANAVINFHLANFRVVSSVSKTSGAGVHLENCGRFFMNNIVADSQDGNGNLWNGIWFDKVGPAFLDGFEASSCQNDGIRVNGDTAVNGLKADCAIDNGKITKNGNIGILCGGAFGGLVVDKVDVINNITNMVIDQSLAAQANREVFLTAGCLIDSPDSTSGDDCLRINDAGGLLLQATGTWIAGAQRHGVYVQDCGGKLYFTGVRLFDNGRSSGDGLRIEDASAFVVFSGGGIHDQTTGWGINATVSTPRLRVSEHTQFVSNSSGDVRWANAEVPQGFSFVVTIADDAVFSFTPLQKTGHVVVHKDGTIERGMYPYRAETGGSFMTPIQESANFTSTTGALVGTTGVDGDTTISAHTDEKIYLENRSGAQSAYRIRLL